jgi:hypothetical protein
LNKKIKNCPQQKIYVIWQLVLKMSILAIKKLLQLENDVFQNAKRRIFKPLATIRAIQRI